MKSWQEFKIGDLCEVGRGSSPRPILDQKYFAGGDIPWIKIADATASGKYIYRTEEHVNEYGASFSRYLEPNSLIIAASGVSLGQIKFLGVKGCIHDGWLYASNYNDSLLKEYLYYYLKYYSKAFHKFSYGAAIQNINTEIFRNTKIKLPPLPIQQKIASILSAYDDLIENNKRRIQLLEEMAEEIYKEGFVRMRFPGYENAKFYDEAGQEVPHGTAGALPEGWEKVKAEKLYNINIGKTPPRKESHWFTSENQGIKWLSIKDINNSTVFAFNTSEEITFDGIKKFNVNVVPKNTVVLSFKLTVGKVIIVASDMATNEAIAHFNIKNYNKINREYTYCYLNNFKYEELGNTSSIGTAINSKIVKKMPIILPTSSLLSSFAKVILPILDELQILCQKNEILQQTRDLLLPRLISGKLSVAHLLKKEENDLIAAEPEAQYQKQ